MVETSDNQLYVGLTNQIDTTDSVYLKLKTQTLIQKLQTTIFLLIMDKRC